MSSLPITIAPSIAAKAGSNGASYSKFGDITVAPLCISHCKTNTTTNSSKDSNCLSVRVGDLKKTFPSAIMRLLQLQLPRYSSLKLSLTPSIVTFILQSRDGDNWAVNTGDEYTPYQTGDQADSRSNLIELGPVTLVQRRLTWQFVALYCSALNELVREIRANQWTIGLATELHSTVHLILLIRRVWRVQVDRLMYVLLRPKAPPSLQPIKRKRFVCTLFDAPSSVANRAEFESNSNITTTSRSSRSTTTKSNKLIIVHPSVASKSVSHSLCTFDKSCSWPTKSCCPLPSPAPTVCTKRFVLFSLFYIYCVLLLCTGAYHIDTQSAYDQKQTTIQSDSSDPGWFPNPPDKAQLRARTPNYLFRLHDRHMRNWLDFDQFEADRLRHPIHRHRLGNLNWDAARLGAITAVRHHRHMGTFRDHAMGNDPFVQPLLRHHPPESELRGHRLMFRLAEMPENEQLIAASLRLRYEPSTVRNSSSTTDRIRAHCGNSKIDSHYWPITLWLHYDSKNQSHPWDLETVGSFEPDEPICEWSMLGLNNHTMLHLPPGWFHIPLSSTILSLLQEVNMYSDPSKYVTIRLRSLSPRAYKDPTLNELRLHPRSEDAVELAQWVHEAPHLFTFHRDPDVLPSTKRTRRSIPDRNIGSDEPVQQAPATTKPGPREQFHRNPITTAHMDLRSRARRGATFEKRYRRLQRMLHSGLRNVEQKNRPRRRASMMPRRNSRASPDEWRQDSMTRDSYYYGSASGQSIDPGDAYSQSTKDGFQGRGLSPGRNRNTYGSTRTETSGDEFHNMDSISANDYLESTCQRRDLVIDFDAVGWAGWVIAPQAYNARYCRGQCPFPLSTHYNTTNHAVLLQLVHLLDAARISGPCCVPNQLSSQSLLYHKQNGDVVLRVYQDMVVESCACR